MRRSMEVVLGMLASGGLLLTAGCDGGSPSDDDTGGDDDTAGAAGLTIRGTIHDLADFSVRSEGLTVFIADPAEMLLSGGDPTILGTAEPRDDGTFEITGVDASGAGYGLIMIVDDVGDAVVGTATGIHASAYEGWSDGDVLEDQIAFATPAAYVTDLETDLAAAGWDGDDLFAEGAVIGFVQQDDLTPIAGATVSSIGGDVYHADGDPVGEGALDDGAGQPNGATTAEGNGLWVAPGGGVAPWTCTAEGYTFEDIFVGSTGEILVVIAFRPEA